MDHFWSRARAVAVVALFAAFPGAVLAEDGELLPGGGFPSDFGHATIEASRRAVRSRIRDWKEDLAEAVPARDAYCMLAASSPLLIAAPLASSITLATLQMMPRYLRLTGADAVPGRVVRPLEGRLRAVAVLADLTDDEREALSRLEATEVADLSDRLRLYIDTQWFLMRLANRLYDERIDYHRSRTEGFWGFFRKEAELCAAYTLQADRDNQLITAARRVLAFYYFLEREIESLD